MNSFTTDPPAVTINGEKKPLRPYSSGFERRVIPVVRELMPDAAPGDLGLMVFVAFAVFHSITPADALALLADKDKTEAALDAAQMELSINDLGAIAEYFAGITQRAEAAQVENEGPAGKPEEATRPTT